MKTKTKFKQTEIGMIPEDWEVKELQELCFVEMGQSPPSKSYNSDGEGMLFLQGVRTFGSKYPRFDTWTNDPKKTAKKGDVLFSVRAPVGKLNITEEEICIGRGIAALSMKNQNNEFLYYLLKSLKNKILKHQTGTVFGSINKDTIKKIKLLSPPLREQKAIVEVVINVDDLIQQLNELIVKKQNIKRGVMQGLLTGKRRLSGFKGEWLIKELGRIVDIKKGQLITENTRVEGSVPVIAGGKTPPYYHNKPNRLKKTITISASGAYAGYVSFHDYPIFASDCLTIEEGADYSIEYIHFQLQRLQNTIYKLQTGGAQPHIHAKDIAPLEIPIPQRKEEQKTIAQILSDIETEIKALKKKRNKYKKIKQCMMQQLLTGKIRLK